jgi:outer membrane protein
VKLLVLLLFCSSALAKTGEKPLPLWEVGVGFLSFRADHYRGSDQYTEYFWPTPYFIYRGEKLRAENSFIEGQFFRWGLFSLNVSLSAGLPVNSEKNRARAGMPDIHSTFETGVLARFRLWENQERWFNMEFRLPFRAVTATDLKEWEHIGFFSVPYLNWAVKATKRTWGIGIEGSIAPMFATQKYHDYFFGVSPQFATAGRPAFKPRGGYSGLQLSLIVTKRWGDVFFLPFVRYDLLKQAKFEHSPLVRKKSYFLGGLGFVWFFLKSSKTQRGGSYR